MRGTRRTIALLLGMIMLLTMVYSTAFAAGEPIKLRFWAHWGSEQRRPTIEKIVNLFNEKYKDQNVQVEYVYVPYSDIETKMIASVTAGNPASVVITAIEDVAVKAMRNQAENITQYLTPGIQDSFYAKYWDMATWENNVYAIPFNTDTRLIYFNKAMFEKAGVKAEEIKTWEDLQNACVKVDEAMKGDPNYMLAFYPTLGNFGFDTIAMSNGSNGIFDNNVNPDKVNLASKENIEALTFMKWFADRYGQEKVQATDAANAGGAQDLFLSQKVAMFGQTCNYIAGIAKYNAEAKVDYGVFALPAGPSSPDGKPGAWGGGFVCTVPFGTKYPKEATMLAEFIATEGAKIWAVEQKDVMCSIAANENPAMAESVGWAEVIDLMNYTKGTRNHIYVRNAASFKDDAVNSIMKTFTATDPATVLTEAAGKIEKAIESEKFIFGM
ncbi:MAG: extracellular solute-binding protein [Christensenellales bacterium]